MIPCPEFTGKGICVDVTPLRSKQTKFGERLVFKVVFEIHHAGKFHFVWSDNFTPTLSQLSKFRIFLERWFGRNLSVAELQDFDTESLLGKPAHLVIIHQPGADAKIYANIASCTPDTGAPLVPSGKFIRTKDRVSKPVGDDVRRLQSNP